MYNNDKDRKRLTWTLGRLNTNLKSVTRSLGLNRYRLKDVHKGRAVMFMFIVEDLDVLSYDLGYSTLTSQLDDRTMIGVFG